MKKISMVYGFCIMTLAGMPSSFAQNNNRYHYQDDRVRISITPRTPEMTTAFYYARGFPAKVIDTLKKQCFLTITIRNTSRDTLQHNIGKWVITSSGQPVMPLTRQYWFDWFRSQNIPLSIQSTFRWTLLPDALDFFPGEGEGGNIILPYTDQPFSVQMKFKLISNNMTQPFNVTFPEVRCAR